MNIGAMVSITVPCAKGKKSQGFDHPAILVAHPATRRTDAKHVRMHGRIPRRVLTDIVALAMMVMIGIATKTALAGTLGRYP